MKTKIKAGLLAGLFTIAVMQTHAQCLTCNSNNSINSGLQLCMPFNGNANDGSPNGLNGTVNGATLTSDRFGTPNAAYSFDGTNDYISFPTTGLTLSTYTYSVWVRVTAAPSNGSAYSVISIGNAGSLGDQDILWGTNYNGSQNGSMAVSYPSPAGLNDIAVSGINATGTWYHVVSVRDVSANRLRIYVNGAMIADDPLVSSTAGYATPVTGNIGARSGAGTFQNFNGVIDDIRIYNRVLSDSEIEKLYDYCCVTCNSTNSINNNLQLCMPFNGNANDEGPNGLNGTVNGATLTSDRFGTPNAAYSFDGINDYISFPATGLTYNTYTYSTWVRVASSPANGAAYSIISIGNAGSLGDQDILWGTNYNGSQNGSIAVSYPSPAGFSDIAVSGINTTGVWYHVVSVRDVSAGRLKIYVNGAMIADDPLVSSTAGYATPVSGIIGGRSGSGTFQNFNGVIDDIRIYNRALSDSEIERLYSFCVDTPPFFKRSPTAIAESKKGLEEILMYPNPVSNNAGLIFEHTEFVTQIEIYNILGERVLYGTNPSGEKSLSLNMSSLTPDIYIVNILNGNKVSQKKLIVK